jgi:hypothetical protein
VATRIRDSRESILLYTFDDDGYKLLFLIDLITFYKAV